MLPEEGSTVIVRFGSFGSTLFGKRKEGLPEGRVKRNLAFNSGGVLLVSVLFANTKRTDIGKVGGFSLDVL